MMRLRTRLRVLCFSLATTSTCSLVQGFTTPTRTCLLSPLLVVTPVVSSSQRSILNIFQIQQPQRHYYRSTTTMSAADATSSSEQEKQTHTRDFQDNNNSNNKESLGLGTKSWRSLMEVSMARSRKIRGSNYVQLATVDPETKEPRCRTVVFRGFQNNVPKDHPFSLSSVLDDLSCIMKMCTDRRSRKVSEASTTESDVGEMVWWFPKSNEQYRIRGNLLFVGGGDFPQDKDTFLMAARKELWGNLSDPARESFLDPNVPGQPVQEDANQPEVPAGGRDKATGKPVPPPDNFLLMLLFPHNVDYLNLKENYRQIDEQSQESDDDNQTSWSFQQVNA